MLEITEGARASPAPFGTESFHVATSTDQARLACGATAIELGPTVSSNETNGLVFRLGSRPRFGPERPPCRDPVRDRRFQIQTSTLQTVRIGIMSRIFPVKFNQQDIYIQAIKVLQPPQTSREPPKLRRLTSQAPAHTTRKDLTSLFNWP